jgi:hypothetical protein
MVGYYEAERPHGNAVLGWQDFLLALCRTAHLKLALPLKQRRSPDGAPYGPMIDFLVAAAGP